MSSVSVTTSVGYWLLCIRLQLLLLPCGNSYATSAHLYTILHRMTITTTSYVMVTPTTIYAKCITLILIATVYSIPTSMYNLLY